NAYFGNRPDDVFTHALGAGDGWTDRKIDPATAAAVQGPWRPRAVNSSGTWSLADIRAECVARAGAPAPPSKGDDVALVIKGSGDSSYAWNGVTCNGIPSLDLVALGAANGLYVSDQPTVIADDQLQALLDNQAERG